MSQALTPADPRDCHRRHGLHPPEKRHPKLKTPSIAPVFADAIRHNLARESLKELFVFGE